MSEQSPEPEASRPASGSPPPTGPVPGSPPGPPYPPGRATAPGPSYGPVPPGGATAPLPRTPAGPTGPPPPVSGRSAVGPSTGAGGVPPEQPVSGPPIGAGGPRRSVLPWAVAALAVVLALVFGGMALYALGKAAGAKQAGPVAGPTTTVDTPTTAAPAPGPNTPTTPDGGSSTTPQLDPEAKFTVAYQQQQLTLRPGNCSSLYLDLDEPRVGADSAPADLNFESGCGTKSTFKLQNDGATASQVDSAAVTPKDCVNSVRTAPISGGVAVPVTDKVVLCIITSLSEAVGQGITRKVVVLQVRSIGEDGTVDVIVSAWNVPR